MVTSIDPDPGSSSADGTLSRLLRQVARQALHLGGERSGHAGPDVSLEYQADPGRPRRDGVNGLLDHAHHLVPLALDRGEHGIGVVRQPAVAYYADSVRDVLSDPLAHAEWRDRE